uniref:Uncharacterized protein n=1 Tax=Rhabditophanes sp. KR3021 TaxID=114890 RepID=A0AC35UA27_9BILA
MSRLQVQEFHSIREVTRNRFQCNVLQNAIVNTSKMVSNLENTNVILFDTNTFDLSQKFIDNGAKRITLVEKNRVAYRNQVNYVNQWKMSNNEMLDTDILFKANRLAGIKYALKTVLLGNDREVFSTSTSTQGKSNSFYDSVMKYQIMGDYLDPLQQISQDLQVENYYASNALLISLIENSKDQIRCMDHLHQEGLKHYSNRKSHLLGQKCKVSFLTFLSADVYSELMASKNNYTHMNKTAFSKSFFMNTFFDIKDFGVFGVEQFHPKLVLPEVTEQRLVKLKANNLDSSLLNGIVIEPRKLEDLSNMGFQIEDEFALRFHFLTICFGKTLRKTTANQLLKSVFGNVPKNLLFEDNLLVTSVTYCEWQNLFPHLLKLQFSNEGRTFHPRKVKLIMKGYPGVIATTVVPATTYEYYSGERSDAA